MRPDLRQYAFDSDGPSESLYSVSERRWHGPAQLRKPRRLNLPTSEPQTPSYASSAYSQSGGRAESPREADAADIANQVGAFLEQLPLGTDAAAAAVLEERIGRRLFRSELREAQLQERVLDWCAPQVVTCSAASTLADSGDCRSVGAAEEMAQLLAHKELLIRSMASAQPAPWVSGRPLSSPLPHLSVHTVTSSQGETALDSDLQPSRSCGGGTVEVPLRDALDAATMSRVQDELRQLRQEVQRLGGGTRGSHADEAASNAASVAEQMELRAEAAALQKQLQAAREAADLCGVQRGSASTDEQVCSSPASQRVPTRVVIARLLVAAST